MPLTRIQTLRKRWRRTWRWGSVQLAALFAIIGGLLTANQTILIGLIALMPGGWMQLGLALIVGIVLFVVPTIVTIVERKRKDDEHDEDDEQ